MKQEKKCKSTACRRASIGGQALMEGIMMRGPQKSAMAVRRPNGTICFEEEENVKKTRAKIFKAPLIRGVVGFIDSLRLGYKYLMRSADIFMEEELAPKKGESADAAAPVAEGEEKKETSKGGVSAATMAVVTVVATVLGVALALLLFFWLPTFIYQLLADHVLSPKMAESRLARSVFEGLFKIVILVAYMALVSLMKDIRRTFMYHGAEHKTIFCYEQGLPLTVENVRAQRRFHPRCGTSFLILMLLVSIVIGLFIPVQFWGLQGMLNTLVRSAFKILLIPVMMGIGYELLKLAGKYDNVFTRIISAPGMWLQRITVREPSDDMIECAIMAFAAVMPEEERAEYGVSPKEETENTAAQDE